MDYKRFTLKVPRDSFDEIIAELFDLGSLGSEIVSEGEEVTFNVYFKPSARFPERFKAYLLREESLEEKNWGEEWKKFFKPVKVTERAWVAPPWEKGKLRVEGLVIYINPGRGFGTGTHETTQIAMEFIEERLEPGFSFLDVGTGSGILSIFAKKLGALKVIACDVQKNLKGEFEENCFLNGVSDIEFVEGSVDKVEGTFDLVAANIEKHLLVPLLGGIYEKTEKLAVFSGILKSQREEFIEKLHRIGFRVISERGKGQWMGFLCKK